MPTPGASATSTHNALGERVRQQSPTFAPDIQYFFHAHGEESGDYWADQGWWGNAYLNLNGRPVGKTYLEGQVFFFHGNHVGSATMVTDSAGNVTEKLLFYPYGGFRVLAGQFLETGRFASPREGLFHLCGQA